MNALYAEISSAYESVTQRKYIQGYESDAEYGLGPPVDNQFALRMCQLKSDQALTISHFLAPNLFYAYLYNPEYKFDIYIREFYESLGDFFKFEEIPLPGTICIAIYHANKSWYRAKIIKVYTTPNRQQERRCTVMFLDYGNLESDIRLDQLRKLEGSLSTQYDLAIHANRPIRQAILLIIKNIVPKNYADWPLNCDELMRQKVLQNANIRCKIYGLDGSKENALVHTDRREQLGLSRANQSEKVFVMEDLEFDAVLAGSRDGQCGVDSTNTSLNGSFSFSPQSITKLIRDNFELEENVTTADWLSYTEKQLKKFSSENNLYYWLQYSKMADIKWNSIAKASVKPKPTTKNMCGDFRQLFAHLRCEDSEDSETDDDDDHPDNDEKPEKQRIDEEKKNENNGENEGKKQIKQELTTNNNDDKHESETNDRIITPKSGDVNKTIEEEVMKLEKLCLQDLQKVASSSSSPQPLENCKLPHNSVHARSSNSSIASSSEGRDQHGISPDSFDVANATVSNSDDDNDRY